MTIFKDDDEAAPEPEEAPTAVEAEPTRPAGERRAVEAWAAAKGMYPQTTNPPALRLPETAQAAPGGVVAVNLAAVKAPTHNPDFWQFAAAKAMHGWTIGAEVTEEEFDAAVLAATTAMGG